MEVNTAMKITAKRGILLAVVLLVALVVYLDPFAKNVTIKDENETQVMSTHLYSVKEILEEKNIILEECDKVEPELESPLVNDMVINIVRAKPVQIICDGETQEVKTTAQTVQDILSQTNIALQENDKIIPGLHEQVNEQIQVIRVEKKQVTEKKEIAFNIDLKEDPKLYKGERRIIKKGKKGLEEHTYEVVTEDGKETIKDLINKALIKKPVNEIVAIGTREWASRGGNEIKFSKVYDMTATAYSHTGSRTYTGTWPSVGTVAVDPKVIPLGTRMYIDGYGYATAQDIGSAIVGKRIDVFVETEKEARKWGRRKVKVFILQQ